MLNIRHQNLFADSYFNKNPPIWQGFSPKFLIKKEFLEVFSDFLVKSLPFLVKKHKKY